MDVQDLIDALEQIQDKTLTVCLKDWGYYDAEFSSKKPTSELDEVSLQDGEHFNDSEGIKKGRFVCLDVSP